MEELSMTPEAQQSQRESEVDECKSCTSRKLCQNTICPKELFRKEIAMWKDEDPLFMAYVQGQEAGRGEASSPHTPAPEHGRWRDKDDPQGCECNTEAGYRLGYAEAARTATLAAQNDIPEFIDTICFIDLYQYVHNEKDIEDISKCRGKECNYCGKFNEQSTAAEKQEEPR
jgi:hypothetical protein